MKKLVSLLTLILVISASQLPAAQGKELDASDNKSPVLVSVSINKSSLIEGENALVTVVIRDDKNELKSWPLVLFGSPVDSPGSISGGIFTYGGRGLILTVVTTEYVEQTFEYEIKAPSWPGNYYGFNIQGVVDKNGNEVGFDLKKCTNTNIYPSSQAMAFPALVPVCNTSFNVRLLTAAEKAAAEKAAAEKAAAEKAAAEKAAADKAAAEKAAADKAAAAVAAANAKIDAANKAAELANKLASEIAAAAEKAAAEKAAAEKAAADKAAAEKAAADKAAAAVAAANAKIDAANKAAELANKLASEIAAAELKAQQQVAIAAAEAAAIKKTTITCVKGKVMKKITAVKPVCPSGYKKK